MPSRQDHHFLTRTSFGGGSSAGSVWGGGTYGSYQALAAAAAPPPPWQPAGGYQQWGYHNQSFLKWRTWTQPAGSPFLKGYDASQFVSAPLPSPREGTQSGVRSLSQSGIHSGTLAACSFCLMISLHPYLLGVFLLFSHRSLGSAAPGVCVSRVIDNLALRLLIFVSFIETRPLSKRAATIAPQREPFFTLMPRSRSEL